MGSPCAVSIGSRITSYNVCYTKLLRYGRSSGFCIDPIEKKPLHHFYPGTPVLSFGTAGCNLACRFCQNWDMSKSREMDTLADAASPGELAATARRSRRGCAAPRARPAGPTCVITSYSIHYTKLYDSRDLLMSQFWQNLQERLQPAVPKESMGVPA